MNWIESGKIWSKLNVILPSLKEQRRVLELIVIFGYDDEYEFFKYDENYIDTGCMRRQFRGAAATFPPVLLCGQHFIGTLSKMIMPMKWIVTNKCDCRCIIPSKQFENFFRNTQWRKDKQKTNVTMHILNYTIWGFNKYSQFSLSGEDNLRRRFKIQSRKVKQIKPAEWLSMPFTMNK